MDDVDLLVIGAGPTGLTVAAVAAAAGADVAVVDAASGPERESSRATTVHAVTLEQLDRLDGAGAEIVGRAMRATTSSLWSGTRRVATVYWNRIPSRYAYMVNLPQTETEQVLRSRLASTGVDVHWTTKATEVEVDPDGPRVELDAGGRKKHLRARFVVGCDGAHSIVRRSIGVPLEGKTHEERFLLGDVELKTELPRDRTHVFVSTKGVLGIMPMPGGRFRLNGTLTAGETLTPGGLPQLMSGRLRGRPGVEVRDVAWLAEYRTHSRLAARYAVGPVFLAGDAAHLNSPVGGQGMNIGIQDGINLGWKLARVLKRRAPRSLLDTYEAERRPIAATVLRASEASTRMITARRPVERALRNALMYTVHRFSAVQAKLALEPAGLAQQYQSDAVATATRGGSPLAGRRLPNPLLFETPKRWLYDELPGFEYDLLLFGATESSRSLIGLARQYGIRIRRVTSTETAANAEAIADPSHAILHALPDRRCDAVLVRPDGVVAWVGSDPTECARHLANIAIQTTSVTAQTGLGTGNR